MVIRVAESIWAVEANDPSIPRFGQRDGDTVTIHGYVHWTGQKFVPYFHYATILTEDRAKRCKDPEVMPVPDNPFARSMAASAIMLEFWPMLWGDPRPVAEILERVKELKTPSVDKTLDAEDLDAIKELQAQIDSVDDEGNVIEPGTDGDQ